MTSSTRTSTAHGLAVLAFSAVAMAGMMGHGKAGLTGGDDGGLDIPGLGNNSTPQSCTLTSSDPRNKDSCNSSGNNGSDGGAGYVHENSPHRHYSDDSDNRRDQDDSDY